ncbi:MAG TPA: hypothetical protein VGK22_03000 [Candidatus Angelobacter sp.]|jgi:hypothetical protein
MPVLRIDIVGDPKSIPFRTFGHVANDSLSILGDLDRALSFRSGGSTEWFMNDISKNGVLRLEIYSQLKARNVRADVGRDIANSFVTGFKTLEIEGKSPAFLSDKGMRKAEHLTSLIDERGARAIVASIPETEKAVEITRHSATNIQKLIPEAYTAIGSVEGLLETISVHKNKKFIVYQGMTGKAVTCQFPKLELMDKVKQFLGERVQVSGIISRNEKGEPVRVLLQKESDLKIFGYDLKILPFKKLGGSDPNFTGDLSTEDFIRKIRG